MDAKCQKRKYSRKSKKVVGDNNTNVLVVPPDILKKLGINISSTPKQQIASDVSAVQSPQIENKASSVNILSGYIDKGNESSIQETANLMKKSVFLSPTFVDTIANAIPGEVEFSNNKCFIAFEVDRTLPLEKLQVTNDVCEQISQHGAMNCGIIRNGLTTGTVVYEDIQSHVEVNSNSISQNFTAVRDQCPNELLSIKQEYISHQENNGTVSEVRLEPAKIDKPNENAITPEEINLINNLISLPGDVQVINQTDENIKNILDNKQLILVDQKSGTGKIAVNSGAIEIEYADLSFEDNIKLITKSDLHNNLIPLDSNSNTLPVQIEPTEDVNNSIISLKENIHFVDEPIKVNNLASLEKSSVAVQLPELSSYSNSKENNGNNIVDVCIEANKFTIENSVPQINQIEYATQYKKTDILYNLITSDKNVRLIQKYQEEIEKINSFKKNFEQNYSGVLDNTKPLINEIMPKNNDVSSKEFFYLNGNDLHTEKDQTQNTLPKNEYDNNNTSVIMVPMEEIGEQNLLNDNNKKNINKFTNSNPSLNGKLPFVTNGEVNESINVNTVFNEDKLELESTIAQYPYGSANKFDQNVTIKSVISKNPVLTRTYGDIVTAINKIDQKIHIISQETIIPSNSNECKKSYSSNINPKNCHGNSLGNKITINDSSMSYNFNLLNSEPKLANTQVDSTIHDNMFSVEFKSDKSSENAVIINNNRNCVSNKDSVNLVDISGVKTISTDKQSDEIDKNHNSDYKRYIEKKTDNKKILKQEKNLSKKVNSSEENEEFCEDQLNNILKSTKENNNAIMQADKVKEIANYIKRFAHIYKNKNKLKDRNIKNTKNGKRESINTKTTMTKSKLCIQGVEKPGGNKSHMEMSGETKVLKTYVRQKKNQDFQRSQNNSFNNDPKSCDVHDRSDIDLNTIDISMSLKTQVFCLCHDFGHLYDCDNSYEHIHFWLHNTSSDLETILSIYNDDDTIFTDRTQLDDIKLSEIDDTEIDNICWNYFMNDQSQLQYKTSDKQVIKDFHIAKTEQIVTGFEQEEPKNILCENSNNSRKIYDEIDRQSTSNVNKCINSKELVSITNELGKEKKIIENNNAGTSDIQSETDMSCDTNVIHEEHQSCDTSVATTEIFTTHDARCVDKKKKSLRDIDEVRDVLPKEKSQMPSDMHKKKETIFEANTKKSLKRGRDSFESTSYVSYDIPSAKKSIKCGICDKLFAEANWEHHVAKKHCHIAWPAGSSFNIDDPALSKKLQQTLQDVGKLKCPSCYMQTKVFEKFMSHIKQCLGLQVTSSRRTSYKKDTVICGVCKKNLDYTSWIEHIGKEHNYLAWIDGMKVLDMEDKSAVINHLKVIIRNSGSLVCSKCGLNRQRAQLYLEHIKTCNRSESHISKEMDLTNDQEDHDPVTPDKKILTCGVCKIEVPILKWIEHIAKKHNYLAWEEGSTPLDIDDKEAVWKHLQEFIRQSGDGLICYKCGLSRRRVKLYLSHIKTCDGKGVDLDETEDVSIMEQSTSDKKEMICGVCNVAVSIIDWNEHIGREHNYLAWEAGKTPLDLNDEEAVKEHLLDIIRNCEGLICYKCGLNRKRAKLYLSHVKNCDGSQSQCNESTDSVNIKSEGVEQIEITIDESNEIVKCAVCDQDVSQDMWIEHIGKEHQYLAWQQGKTPLDVTDENAVKVHLCNISRQKDGLTCNKCNTVKKYPKTFQQHIADCNGIPSLNDSRMKIYESGVDHFDVSNVKTETVTCGVCGKDIQTTMWITHIQRKHNYIAWFVGKPPINVDDPLMVQKHLIDVCRKIGALKCNKCGVVRKYAKKYLNHIASCQFESVNSEYADTMHSKGPVECGVCAEILDYKDWRDHAMKKHYNVAWIAGEPPIDINLPYVVEHYIKEYQQKNNNKLVCKTCRATRVSAVGFYAHIITCGKTEEEADRYKGLCEICNNKYLLIYKSQHMTAHKEKENAIERKLLMAKVKEIKDEQSEPVEIVAGRRRAAEKAITVIEKYSSKTNDGTHCSSCGFSSEIESEMSNHVCVDIKYEESDSDVSIDLDHGSSDDDDDDESDVNSNISEEEHEAHKQELARSMKKHGDSACKIQRLPYDIRNLNTYMRRSAQQFVEIHLTDEDLFTEWRKFEYEIVSDADLMKYMPPLEESCKVTYHKENDWIVYKRFESSRKRDIITLFTGACIQAIAWVPLCIKDDSRATQQYLSVITHLDTDVPRYYWHEQPAPKPALIQIWNCGNLLGGVPEFVMGISLDYGSIWAFDWCPSGSRDILDINEDEPNKPQRLGLVATACANGSTYIFAVPYPSTIQEKGQILCKLKPVAELRLAMRTDRKVYQATAVKWSTQKGHSHVIVGYGDGTTAYFDLKNESPLLKSTENDVTILYPYYDERAQGMCIEDVDVFPTLDLSRGPGPVVAGSVGGVGTRSGPAGSATLHAHSAAARVIFPPHWPAPLLAGDDNLVSQAVNELEWYGGGRRVGGMRACCGCAWCGRIAVTSAPLVRLVRTHPAYSDLRRQVIAMVQMIPFSNKRKRKNDELSMLLEPLTYKDAVEKYGIEFKQIMAKDKNTQQQLSATPRESFPERFPLAEITSMMFCPSSVNHNKLAIGVHGGLVFIINV